MRACFTQKGSTGAQFLMCTAMRHCCGWSWMAVLCELLSICKFQVLFNIQLCLIRDNGYRRVPFFVPHGPFLRLPVLTTTGSIISSSHYRLGVYFWIDSIEKWIEWSLSHLYAYMFRICRLSIRGGGRGGGAGVCLRGFPFNSHARKLYYQVKKHDNVGLTKYIRFLLPLENSRPLFFNGNTR